MAAILKFIGEDGTELSELDMGMNRKGIAKVSKFKVKNEGDITARDIIITSATLNGETEVDEIEYHNQQKAVDWKTFSRDNKTFSKQLGLGSVKPNAYVEGEKDYKLNFETEDKCAFVDVWNAGVTEYKLNRHVFKKLDNTAKGQTAKRVYINNYSDSRDVEIEFNVEFSCNVEEQESFLPFIGVPVRINSKSDEMGYMFIIHYRRDDGKYKVTIYKNAKGMVANENRDYGDPFIDTIQWLPFDKSKKITFKIYNNALGQPTFEVLYDGKNVKLGRAFISSIQGYVLSDTSNTAYTDKGKTYLDFSLYDGDYFSAISNMTIKVEEPQQYIYVKSLLDDRAENKVVYNTSAMLSYIED